MSTPYSYLVVFTNPNNSKKLYYYGIQYGKRADPSNLWTTYFTSSKTIKWLRHKFGDSCFSYEIRRTFTTEKQAKDWEHKVLRRMNVVENEDWLNRNDSYGPPLLKKEDNFWFGKSLREDTKRKLSETAKKRWANSEFREYIMSEIVPFRDTTWARSDEHKEFKSRLGKHQHETNPNWLTRRSHKGKNNGMYGKRHSKETRQILSERKQGVFEGEHNPMFGVKRSDDFKKALSNKTKGRKRMHDPETGKNYTVLKEDIVQRSFQGWEFGWK